jgi:hypothetical protein
MKDTRSATFKMIFVIVILVSVVGYVYFIAPYFESKISDFRLENNIMKHDMSEIDAMKGDTTAIDKNIADTKAKLDALRVAASVIPENMMADISEKAEAAGLSLLEAAPSDPEKIGERTAYGVQLYSQLVSLSVSGGYKKGVDFMNGLEQSPKGVYRIENFVFRGVPGGTDSEGDTDDTDSERNAADTDSESDTDDTDDTDPENTENENDGSKWMMDVVLYYYSEA